MKKNYVRPTMVGERFAANEYVAACGDKGTVYKFKCDAGDGVHGGVWYETNGTSGLQAGWGVTNPDQQISTSMSSFHACDIEHEASTTASFRNGYYLPSGKDTKDAVAVVIWRGPDNNNVHCTTNLDINSWETAKS